MCGEESGIEFIRHIAMVTGDDLEVRKYKRLTSLTVLDKAVGKIFQWFSHCSWMLKCESLIFEI